MKVLHVVENLDRGAVENWLVTAFIEARCYRSDVKWSFYCVLGRPGRLDAVVRQNGGSIVYSPVNLSNTLAFMAALRKYLKAQSFDVLHCHHDFLSGLYLLSSAFLSIGKRIIHVHNTDEGLPTPSKLKKNLLLEPLRQSCFRLSDGIIGISSHTLDVFLNGRPRRWGRDCVLHYAVALDKIAAAPCDRIEFCKVMRVPIESKVILFAGRLNPLKNPFFALEVFRSLLSQESQAVALFCGDGELMAELTSRVGSFGMGGRVRVLGWRDDLPWLMKNSDLFLFPRLESPKEGLGLAIVESQACGLPVLASNGICEESIVDRDLVTVLPLERGTAEWAACAAKLLLKPRKAFEACKLAVEQSQFGLKNSVPKLLQYYDSY